MKEQATKYLAIFASGTGSNAKKIVDYFEHDARIKIGVIVSNKKTAPVLEMASQHHIPTIIINKKEFYHSSKVVEQLVDFQIDFIVLAGFLWLVPSSLIEAYPQKIINIHPALLPKYGGKDMYGMNVHEAVFANKEKESGITIHYVNERYDEGAIIFQAACPISSLNSSIEIRNAVLKLEHHYFPRIIEGLLT